MTLKYLFIIEPLVLVVVTFTLTLKYLRYSSEMLVSSISFTEHPLKVLRLPKSESSCNDFNVLY